MPIYCLQQDVCDYGFPAAKDTYAILLMQIEEAEMSCADLSLIQALRQSYVYKSQEGKQAYNNSTTEVIGIMLTIPGFVEIAILY